MVKVKHHLAGLGVFGLMFSVLALILAFEPSPASPGKLATTAGLLQRSRSVTSVDEPRKWLDEEVNYIITTEERTAFKRLTTDEERDQFIEGFWERRNPYPGFLENLFEEHFYRRIAYANDEFSTTEPGWGTDRGRMFIVYGFPDEIDPHPSGGTLPTNQRVAFPFEIWRYHCLEPFGKNITEVFTDPSSSGDYHLIEYTVGLNPFQAYIPPSGPNSHGLIPDCGNELFAGRLPPSTQVDRFTKVDVLARTETSDLFAVVASHLSLHQLPFQVRADSIPLTEATSLVPITLEVPNRELQFELRGDTRVARLKILGEFSRLSGRIARVFARELSWEVPAADYPKHVQPGTLDQQLAPLPPGIYRLTLVVKDVASGRAGLTSMRVEVPALRPGVLSASSVILADSLEPQPKIQDYAQPFVVGATELRPNINLSFARGQTLGLYLQIHNIALDAKTHKPSLSVTYEILKGSKILLSEPEDTEILNRAMAILTLRHGFPLKEVAPGRYTLRVKVNDGISQQSITPSAKFEVH